MTLTHLSDEELLSSLTKVCRDMSSALARLLVHLQEVEARRLELRSACSSLFDFCTRRLGMSEAEACRRIDAARLVKRFPCLLGPIERGELHLTGLLLLRDHFTTDNVEALSLAVRGKTKHEIQELIAARAPKPDVFPTLTALPPARASAPWPSPPTPPARVEPLAPSRHRLELTVSSDVRDKLERARDLLGHRIPKGDFEAVLDAALDTLLAKLEKERPGAGIPAEVRRAVFARDGERCTFTDAEGNRCASRTRLELDHRVPRARGGSNDAANLAVVCRAHNLLRAEQAFGREHVRRQIYLRQRRKEPEANPVARGALVHLGFRDRDVRRVLEDLATRGEDAAPLPEIIRRALRLLTTPVSPR